jgi:hypothetical protein
MENSKQRRGAHISTPTPVPANTVIRYAVAAGDTGQIAYVDGMHAHWPPLPFEGDTLTVPFLVDPVTRQPVQVQVLEIQEHLHLQPPSLVVVVGRRH